MIDKTEELAEEFELITNIRPKVNSKKEVITFHPHDRYDAKASKELHEYGYGPFCEFKVPGSARGKEGVFLLFTGGEVQYVGDCGDLRDKFNFGCGYIAPRDCYEGGQPENCRINNLILEAFIKGQEIKLYFKAAENRKQKKQELITRFSPDWNREILQKKEAAGSSSAEETKSDRQKTEQKKSAAQSRTGKYTPLKEYLQSLEKKEDTLTFSEIEEILEADLPQSAYKYSGWWANGGHAHAEYWLEAGWRVEELELGEYVKFVEMEN